MEYKKTIIDLLVINSNKITGEMISTLFGERLRSFGFVSRDKGREWYTIQDNGVLCSIVFDLLFPCCIYIRFQPMCTEIILPFKSGKYANIDHINLSINAIHLISRLDENKDRYIIDERLRNLQYGCEGLRGKLVFLTELFEKAILPLLSSELSYSDYSKLPCNDFESRAIFAYMSGNSELFYESFHVMGCIFSSTIYNNIIRKAAEMQDMSVIGKNCQEKEMKNLARLKRKLPELFEAKTITPIFTDDFIMNCTVKEIKTTYDYINDYANPMTNRGVRFIPIPMIPCNNQIPPEESRIDTKNAILEHFSEMLHSRGFIACNNGFQWHKLIDGVIHQSLWFVWYSMSSDIEIMYSASTICDYFDFDDCPKSPNVQRTAREYYSLFGLPFLSETYSNAFSSGEEAKLWALTKYETILSHIVFPYFEATETLDGLFAKAYKDASAKILLWGRDILTDEDTKRGTYVSQYKAVKLTDDDLLWFREKERVEETKDSNYIQHYLSLCYEHNIKRIKEIIPQLLA